MLRILLLASVCALMAVPVWAQEPEANDEIQRPKLIKYNIAPALEAAREAAKNGDFEKAERLYLMILKVLPDFSPVRMEYAKVARQAGKTRLARDILKPLDVDALPPGERSAYRNIYWGDRAFGLSLSPRLMFDSNKNNGPKRQTINIRGLQFRLADEDMPKTSYGAGASLAGQALWMLHPYFGIGGDAVVDADFYKKSDENDLNYTVSFGPRGRVGDIYLRANALGGQRYLGGEKLEQHLGGQVAASFAVQGTPMNISVSKRYYRGGAASTIPRERETLSVAGSMVMANALPWEGNVSVFGGYEREDWTRRNAEDNKAYRFGGLMELPRNGYVDPVLMMTVTRRLYDNPVPLLNEVRREWRLEPSVRFDFSIVKTPFGVPYLQYGYIRNKSTVSLVDYDQHKLTAGLVIKAF